MQEWFNWHAWKACVPLEAGPGVRIPLSPQQQGNSRARARLFCFYAEPTLVHQVEDLHKNKNKSGETGFALLLLGSPKGITAGNPLLSCTHPRPLSSRQKAGNEGCRQYLLQQIFPTVKTSKKISQGTHRLV
jgi:hypothetical protein